VQIIDADGHITEHRYLEEIARHMPGGQTGNIFPPLDHFHTYHFRPGRAVFGSPDAAEWIEFLDDVGIDWTAVYPSLALAVGRIVSIDWAIATCRAYNNWLHERYVNVTPRVKGVALIPLQDPHAAAEELRRAVTQLGMTAAMLPSNGEGIKAHLGDRMFWPVYEEAQRLGCALAVHGGCHHHFGMDTFSTYYPIHALGHPFGIVVQAAAMLSHGIFDHFPGLRVGFLEGGATWVPFYLDRMRRSYEGHVQQDIHGNYLEGPQPSEGAIEHFKRHVREGRIYVGFDCDDEGLGYAIQRAGREPFLFASDYPHESFNAQTCRREIDELLERADLSEADKAAVLAENARRFYGVDA
jgi:predicted TIM-barrel fold metal-dependent hydrolase